ncbi:MAG TPA: MFS transporter, partial [Thermodesulfobacteriota bacterium]|nr:MFS transporter [Thermodesulfobacteriota bacterium]
QWVSFSVTFYMIPYVLFQLFSGPIAQIFQTRRTLLFGFAAYAIGGFLSAVSTSLWGLVAARFIQGFGAAFIAPIVLALVGEMVEPRRLGKAMGIMGIMYTAGVTMGPLISGLLETSLGWPSFFFFLMSFSLGIGTLYWATSRKDVQGPARGTVSDALKLIREAFGYRDVRFLSLAAFALFLGYIGLMTFVADYLKISVSLSSDRIGLMLSMTGFFGMLAAPVAGYLGDRFGRVPIAYLGGGIMVCATLVMGAFDYAYGKYVCVFALFGTGSATAWTSLNTLAVEIVPNLRKPVASVYNSFKFTGYALSPVALSLLYAPFSLPGVRWGCIFCILLSLFFASKVAGNRRKMKNSIDIELA